MTKCRVCCRAFIVGESPSLLSCHYFGASAHPETPDGQGEVFDLETSHFSQGQGNQGLERRRSALRRTIKSAD